MMRRLKNELIWIGPFVLLGLMAVTLFRPWTTVPPVTQGRTILDGKGREVIIPEHFPGVVTGIYTGDFLLKTHAPEAILKIDGPRARPRPGTRWGLDYRIYPQLVGDDTLWDFPTGTESVLAQDAGGVYLSGGAFFKEFGLTTVDFFADWEAQEEEYGATFTMTRVLNRIIGREEVAEVLIARFRRELAELTAELQVDTIPEEERPRVMGMIDAGWERVNGSIGGSDSRLGTRGPAKGEEGFVARGRDGDAERILAQRPDVIVLRGGDADVFLRDRRWRGMEAVRSGRVYTNPTPINGYTFDLDNPPLALRWQAEIYHPGRMQPKLRERVRSHYQESYGYRLSDGEIDEMLRVGVNRDSKYYERFTSHAAPTTPEM